MASAGSSTPASAYAWPHGATIDLPSESLARRSRCTARRRSARLGAEALPSKRPIANRICDLDQPSMTAALAPDDDLVAGVLDFAEGREWERHDDHARRQKRGRVLR